MLQTQRELLDDFLSFSTEHGDSVARAIANRALNRALLTIWLKHPWAQFRAQSPYEFATVAGTRDYVLPRHFGRMAARDGAIRNLTQPREIFPVNRDDLNATHPSAGTSLETRGAPDRYLLDNTIGVSVQPAAAGEACELVSSSADDDDVDVYLEGLDASGVYKATKVTLTGTTPVAAGTWSRIEQFGKGYAAGTDPAVDQTTSVGTVTLRTVAGPTTLQTLLPDESGLDLVVLTLVPVPDAVYTIAVPYMLMPRRLYRDSQPLPRLWGNVLFEELCVSWLVNKGKVASDASVPRPHLADLLALENASRVPFTQHRRPYGGR